MQARSARRRVIAVKAAMGAADPRRGTTMATDRDDPDFERPHRSSSIDHVLSELQLYGYRPFQDEPDPPAVATSQRRQWRRGRHLRRTDRDTL